ncbi:sugar phosphate isomerase/epimerase family protein [Saccharopolyspora phatthalungensis]|uniref:Sugar phosphate isomerase/epimerase n=1 Tax=Saccharopolyspora phatthalungensis TaxID=664693 RepID=A0A840Q8E0_9PSEU|nr:sugar phosphate isomerase/epimerase family protein [Saccharopolyspora phatthalungensis]MBB5158792.1 sugar phosphate isomerase/epimerase [Saccharopolyspora phatthalungensis]
MHSELRFPVRRLAGIGDEAAVDFEGQVAAIRALDWRAVELRAVDATAMGDLDPDAFRRVADRLRAEQIEVVGLASRIGNWARPISVPFDEELAELDTLADQCAALDCRYIRIMSYPNDGLTEADWAGRVLERIAALSRRAEQLGVTLLHENCAGWAGHSADRMLRLLDEVGSPALKLLFDTGNGVPHGYDASDLLVKILPHVAHVHVKDAVSTPEGTAYTLPGDGDARVAECLRLLLAAGYSGVLSLEPHLATRPHENLQAVGDAATLFIRAGQRLSRLLDHAVLPKLSGCGTGR